MTSFPDTRMSLIMRLTESETQRIDHAAWREFADSYMPLIYRFAKRRGLQDADAQELVQRVLLSVIQAIGRWKPAELSAEGKIPRFRHWLFTIARNQLINFIKQHQRMPATGGTDHIYAMAQVAGPAQSFNKQNELQILEENELLACFEHEALLWATTQVKMQVAPQTWSAFWRTVVLGDSCQDVSEELQLSVGSVYAARSRVLARIKNLIELANSNVVPFRTEELK